MRSTILLLALAAAARADRYLDEFFAGRVLNARGNFVTLHYDFEHPNQLQDFELRAPDGLFEKSGGAARIEKGMLVLERDTALLHRMVGKGGLNARFKLRVHLKRDCGLLVAGDEGFVLVDFFDHRFRDHGGLMLGGFVNGAPLKWKQIVSAMPQAAGKFFGVDSAAEVEFGRRDGREDLRVETFHAHRSSLLKTKPMPRQRFGFWVGQGAISIEELTLTLELEQGYLQEHKLRPIPATDLALEQTTLPKLVLQARQKPLSVQAARARRELSLRGPQGWKKLFTLVRGFGRKQAYAALPIILDLANGPEEQRREHLVKLARSKYPDDLKLAILRGLVKWYPKDAALLHEGLKLKTSGRRALLRELVLRGLPDEVLKGLVEDRLLADEVYSVLKDRGLQLSATELGDLPRVRALEALSPAAARAILEDFAAQPDWGLVEGLIQLLADKDQQARRGAYLLLLTLSGKDLPEDADLWRSWLAAKRSSYEPPPLSAPGVATAAILRGVEFLKKDLADDGACVWPVSPDWPGTRVGATALGVVALRAAGVPCDDAAIAKALHTTLLVSKEGVVALRSDLQDYTYALSLLAMALHSVDAKAYRPQLEILAERLSVGQLQNGQWTYHCRDKTHKRRAKAGDNSNTQYAVLGLRAARLAGVKIEQDVWRRNSGFWLKTMNAWGGWGYGPKGTTQHELSMTSAGVATYAICMEALHGVDAVLRVRNSKRIKTGMKRLGELLLVKGYKGEEIYACYGVERACVLTGTRAFNDFDWYHEGAAILVTTQKESGAWGDPEARGITTGAGYGEAVDTAYALLFLKRATTGLAGAGSGGVVKIPIVRPGTVGKGH